jgi:hypothetical protein
MSVSQLCEFSSNHNPMVDCVWSVLEAANDLRDIEVVEACRRIIDAKLRGGSGTQSDLFVVSSFFG